MEELWWVAAGCWRRTPADTHIDSADVHQGPVYLSLRDPVGFDVTLPLPMG